MSGPLRGARGPSGAWGRLKSVTTDPLESVGLPSKGDNRLLDTKTQEIYYAKIVERYMKFCAAAGGGSELEKQFTSMSLTPDRYTPQPPAIDSFPQSPAEDKELSTILMAMRKLREGIVSCSRTDAFAQQVYIFCIRAAILARHLESYHPALLHLIHRIHPVNPLAAADFQEVTGYYILDLACRQRDFNGAYAARRALQFKERRVLKVLEAMVHGSWWLFWRMRRAVDGYQKRLMELSEDEMRIHALKCIGRSYLSVDKTFVEGATERTWDSLKEKNNIGWQLDGVKVIIRKPRGR